MRSKGLYLFMTLLAMSSMWVSALAQSKAFDPSRMDTSADACDDFFQYSNGSWVKNTAIPPAYSRWGTFNILADDNQKIMHDVLEAAAKKKSVAGSDAQLIGDFYASCMDEAAIEKLGAAPLKEMLTKIESVKTRQDMQRMIATFHNNGVRAFFGFGSGADAKNSSMNIANASQGGISLPNRDYYLKDDAKSVETRAKFIEYATNLLKLVGESPETAANDAKTIMEVQMRFAKASKSPVELRNPEARYNKRTVAQLAEMTPNFSWTEYMTARGVPSVTEINIGQPGFFEEFNKMMTDVSIDQWKVYLRWMLVDSAAPRLSKAFVDENFNFYSRYLTGTKEQQPRWKRCVSATDGAVGESLGKEYVKRAFTPAAQKRMSELIDNLFAAYNERLAKLDWMSEETRQKALAKLATYKRKIGFNDKPRGYAGLKISRAAYYSNVRNVATFETARNIKDVGQKVDKTRWGMTPPTVNAYYNPSFNEIVFPAGILQPPFFNFQADDAINYGAIGAVIGHEITHGFDDSGSQYDAEGNLKSWWTKDDRANFEERASCVVNQFNGYEVAPGLNINGKLTLGENIADLGGLTIAYAAFMKSMQGKSRTADIDGLTPEKRFFLGWAQVWAAKSTPEAERQQVLTDPHSNARYRVNGPMSNLPQFKAAFGCKDGQRMVRKDACLIW